MIRQISLEHAWQNRGGRWALRETSVQAQAGRLLVITGENGSGKSTLLHVLLTLLSPERGTLRYNGEPVQTLDTTALRAHMGWVLHDLGCEPTWTSTQFLSWWGAVFGIPATTLAQRVTQGLEQTRLPSDRLIGTFSRGMLQRLALARAFLHEPSLVVLDEPETGLDSQGLQVLHTWVTQALTRQAVVVVATHQASLWDTLSPDRLHLRQGRVVPVSARHTGTSS